MQEWMAYLPYLLKGAGVTIKIASIALFLALIFSFLLGIGRISKFRLVKWLSILIIETVRGCSVLVQLFWIFYALPFIGIRLNPTVAGIIALSVNVGAYGAEAVRAALLAIPDHQTEASIALNYSKWQRMRYVILPQAIKIMLPNIGIIGIDMIKMSAVVSLVTVNDLVLSAQTFRINTGKTFEAFFSILVVYFVYSSLWLSGVRWLERRMDTNR